MLHTQYDINELFCIAVDLGPDLAVHWGLCQGAPHQLHPTQDTGQPRSDGFLCIHKDRPGRYCKS